MSHFQRRQASYALAAAGDERDHGHLQLTCSAFAQHLVPFVSAGSF